MHVALLNCRHCANCQCPFRKVASWACGDGHTPTWCGVEMCRVIDSIRDVLLRHWLTCMLTDLANGEPLAVSRQLSRARCLRVAGASHPASLATTDYKASRQLTPMNDGLPHPSRSPLTSVLLTMKQASLLGLWLAAGALALGGPQRRQEDVNGTNETTTLVPNHYIVEFEAVRDPLMA